MKDMVVLIRGAGEIASAVAHKLARSHLRICLTETGIPQAICRGVAFCEAVYEGEKEVEGVVAKFVASAKDMPKVWKVGKIAIIVDPEATIKDWLHPDVLIDAIMAKKNTGTKISDAPLVIGLGPGFHAGRDVHLVVETNHSENLGRVICQGQAEVNTGIPLYPAGVLYAPKDGLLRLGKNIGEKVSVGDTVAFVDDQPVKARTNGFLRGILRDQSRVKEGMKFGEVDPVGSPEGCYTIRPKMRTIAGGVLEAILMHFNK